MTQIEEVLKERDASAQDIAMLSSPPTNGDDLGGGDMPPSRTVPPPAGHRKGGSGSGSGQQKQHHYGAMRLDKKQIEQRIEEDRERHKRQRENIWAVPPGEHAELEKLWEETSELGEDDHRMGAEEWAEWKAQFEASCPHLRGEAVNGSRS